MCRVAFLSLLLLLISNNGVTQEMKKSDLSGSWYSGDSQLLRQQINGYLDNADVVPFREEVISIICPHAGISVSGETAAYAFKALQGKKIDTVVVVGFSHKLDYNGVAVFNGKGFETPLGVLYSDEFLVKELIAKNEKFIIYPDAFNQENSVELILPFIQVAFDNPKILLLAIGRQSLSNCQVVSEGLYSVLNKKENVLVVASTDLSHYLPLYKAIEVDRQTAQILKTMDCQLLLESCSGRNLMCGSGAVASVMMLSKKLGANKINILKMSTSARTGIIDEKVVGYLSAAFTKDDLPGQELVSDELLSVSQKRQLLILARDAIKFYLEEGENLNEKTEEPQLNAVMGVFVTLRNKGRLRGCIGNIVGRLPLYEGVKEMAVAAAVSDTRFLPLKEEELRDIDIEISVLSPLKKVHDPSEIILGKHGVLVKKGYRSGVYLPQVAEETGWSKEEFLSSLCAQKAGIPKDAWKSNDCQMYIFTAEVFGE